MPIQMNGQYGVPQSIIDKAMVAPAFYVEDKFLGYVAEVSYSLEREDTKISDAPLRDYGFIYDPHIHIGKLYPTREALRDAVIAMYKSEVL